MDERIDLLKKLIEKRTLSGREEEGMEVMEKVMGEEGFEVKRAGKNIFATVGKGPLLLFTTHMDVVPAPQHLFNPKIRQGYVFGRGACDAKGQIVAMFHAFKRLAEKEDELNITLGFGVVVEEEILGEDGSKILAEKLKPEWVVVGEPTELLPMIGHKGVLRGRVVFRGKECHASKARKEENPIYLASKKVIELMNAKKAKNELYGEENIQVTVMRAGKAINIVPEECEIFFDARLIPEGELEKEIRKLTNFEEIVYVKPFVSEEDWLIRRITEKFGKGFFPATCDLHHFKKGIILGAGSLNDAHSLHEKVSIEELRKLEKMLIDIAEMASRQF